MVAGIAIAAALAGATAIGTAINRRAGVLRETGRGSGQDTSGLDLSGTGPTIVHFSADWCGPCSSVRRVVTQVCVDLPDVSHVEIDLDANPGAAMRLSVLSLPTTFIFDADGRQRFRAAGVPKAADLHTVLRPLLA